MLKIVNEPWDLQEGCMSVYVSFPPLVKLGLRPSWARWLGRDGEISIDAFMHWTSLSLQTGERIGGGGGGGGGVL